MADDAGQVLLAILRTQAIALLDGARRALVDAGELTDKGYINQRAVLTRRTGLVDRLYDTPLDASVITLPRTTGARDSLS